jgi:hypothetical protein
VTLNLPSVSFFSPTLLLFSSPGSSLGSSRNC